MPLRPNYPPARKADVVDTYHGVTVADPYRWLEDAGSPETIEWVAAQNALTRSILDGPARQVLVERLTVLINYPRTSVPISRGGRYFFTRNTGLQNQAVLYVQDGRAGQPRVLLDPNALSPDGTVAITALAPNDAGSLVAYGLSYSGSDRQDIFIRDASTARELPDRLQWAKFASIAWTHDGAGFYYTRFPEPGTVPAGDENYFCRVYFHRLGDPQERDLLLFERPDAREVVFTVDVTHGGRWLVVTGFEGASEKSDIHLLDLATPGSRVTRLFEGFQSAWALMDGSQERLFFRTDEGAPRGRIIAVDPSTRDARVVEIVPEDEDKLSNAIIACRTIVASYLHNASDQIRLFELAGARAGAIELPSLGSVVDLSGEPDDDELLIGFTSFTTPPANYRFDCRARTLEPFGATAAFDSSPYETRQVWCTSKDGTQVSMFLVHRRDIELDGARPVLLSGYGGFNVNLTPAFDPAAFLLLDAGGVHAVANLRGGGEYGEDWHQAGMLDRKQNVFDDFIAAAGWLVESGYTHPLRIAVEGGSNGGLLTAAVMVQRPDLFGAVVCRVPVVDMLRYHLFTVGRFWIPEYGSSDVADQFAWLCGYSPYHNVVDGIPYPPILITTADTDDRVAPGMAKKFAARLQAAQGNPSPVLIRVETKAGHGAGKPVSKLIDEGADVFAFVLEYLGVG
jgi:prolyl oligopeptidase